MDHEPSTLQYVLLPGKLLPHSPAIDVYNQVYKYWSQFWIDFWKISTPNGHRDGLRRSSDLCLDFLRQDFISCLLHKDEVIAFQLHSIFDLNQSILEHLSYFEVHNEISRAYFRKNKVQTLMSFEYYGIDSAWRKAHCNQPLGYILTLCGMKLVDLLGIDAGVATTRRQTKVNEMTYKLGWAPIQQNIDYKGHPCDLTIVVPSSLQSEIPEDLYSMFKKYWNQRIDYTQRTLVDREESFSNQVAKKAA